MKKAQSAFEFLNVSYLTRIGNLRVTNLRELAAALENCSAESIFYHCFRSPGRYDILSEGFANEFAHWLLASLRTGELAERVAAVDLRGYSEIEALRADLLRIVSDYCRSHPDDVGRCAAEPFYFCERVELALPLGRQARSLEEFRQGLEELSAASFEFHFVFSRLRLQLRTNDISRWLAEELELGSLAQKIHHIDFLTHTVDGARRRVLEMIEREPLE